MPYEICPDCQATVPQVVNGAQHAYIGASPGCWDIFSQVMAREYENVAYAVAHRMTVDAYMVQHPGQPSPQSIQSVCVHLMGLYWVLDAGWATTKARTGLGLATEIIEFKWLDPPERLGNITIMDIFAAQDAEEHNHQVKRWARCAWEAWQPYHDVIKMWSEEVEAKL